MSSSMDSVPPPATATDAPPAQTPVSVAATHTPVSAADTAVQAPPLAIAPAPPQAAQVQSQVPLHSPQLSAPTLTLGDLENTARNGKKKLYWSAFEVVLSSTLSSGEFQETRYDAYQVNHNHLKKLHAGSRGQIAVRVECKYCKLPRFTQSITVSTKKFEDHYNTLHALDALASADTKKALAIKKANEEGKSVRGSRTAGSDDDEDESMDVDYADGDADADGPDATEDDEAEEDDDEDDDEDNEEGDEDADGQKASRRAKRSAGSAAAPSAKRRRRGALTKDDDDHVAAMQGAAAAVVALSGGAPASSETVVDGSAAPRFATPQSTTARVLDPQDSDTKRAKKTYWTAYEVVITERVSEMAGERETASPRGGGTTAIRETRQDAWRVNHNALRRLHLDPSNATTVRVECKYCQNEPKFSQSITVSTRKFEQHYYYEHGDEKERQELDERIARLAAEGSSPSGQATDQQQAPLVVGLPGRRRKSWRMLLSEQENAAVDARTPKPTAPNANRDRIVAQFPSASATSRGATARYQRARLLNWVLQDNVPLSAFGSEEFRAFVGSLDRKFEAPYPRTVRTLLRERHEDVVSDLKRRLAVECEAATAFALTVDEFPAHSEAQQHQLPPQQIYLAISVHYISRHWKRDQRLIACRAVSKDVTPDQVRGVVQKVLDEFGIPVEKIFAVTTKNAAVVGQAVQALASSPAANGAARSKNTPPAIVELHCAADALRAIAQSGSDALLAAADGVLPLEMLWEHEREAGSPPDWMHVYTTLNEAIKKEQLSVGVVVLRPPELAFAQSVVGLLEPFARVAEDMSRASYPTVAMVFQYYRHLKETLQQQEEVAADTLKPAVTAMQTTLETLYDSVVSVDALVAYILDPRFRFANISKVDEKRIRAKIDAVVVAMHSSSRGDDENAAAADADETSSRGDTASDDSTPGSARPPRSLFEELATSNKRTSIGSTTSNPSSAPTTATGSRATSKALIATLATELEEYLSLDDEDFGVNVLEWWQARESQFPTLSPIAREFLALVATSLPAQETFTVAGQQLAMRRRVLDTETVEMAVVCRAAPEMGMTAPIATPPLRGRPRLTPASTPVVATAEATPPPETEPETEVTASPPDKELCIV